MASRNTHALVTVVMTAVLCICVRARAQAPGAPAAASAGSRPTAELSPKYFPSRDRWEARPAGDVGMDPALLLAAVEWAKAQETDMPRDFSTQREAFGRPLGRVPSTRALTNGIILRHGFIVGEWGDTSAVDPSYSMAKSYLSTLLGLSIDRGLIADIHDQVARSTHDGGYDSPQNAKITWEHHATQTSEWDGSLFGKASTFLGEEEFGKGARQPRELYEPGQYYEYNDVRVNRMSLSLLRLWERPLPEVLKSEILDKIGASQTWVYHGYDNSAVDVGGVPMASVSGGTRWGGGLWMSTRDHARFGLLMLRKGHWEGQQVMSERWVESATTPHGKNPAYGYLWWLNATEAEPEKPFRWVGVSPRCFAAEGAGSNTIWVDPEHDLVVVWRWHAGGDAESELYSRIVTAVKGKD